ncbi:hypothetical protein CMO93_06130 [Candidatus Woesearchaeota archaeon]|nr:hypothetical protein [Candidatus Woesearchaeota archaeon]|tara:strand:- start:1711 stop:2196 length:486 start_codon:yes stop_codon:yes gene_type:complete
MKRNIGLFLEDHRNSTTLYFAPLHTDFASDRISRIQKKDGLHNEDNLLHYYTELSFFKYIIENIELIEKSIGHCRKKGFLEDRDLQDATVRRLEVIGEAAKNIPKNFRKQYKETEWKKIAGLRDIIIHAYFKINLDIIWRIIKEDLPILKKQIADISKSLK